MHRHQIVPPRDAARDIGWRWIKNSHMQHWYRSRSGTTLAFSHCGIVVDKRLLETIQNLPRCQYCNMIEAMRDNQEKQEATEAKLDRSPKPISSMTLDFASPVLRARSMKAEG